MTAVLRLLSAASSYVQGSGSWISDSGSMRSAGGRWTFGVGGITLSLN